MAEASLKIQADFLSAIEQFNKLAAASEQMAQKIQDAKKKFGGTYIDDFINKQKLAEAAMLATKGESVALSNSIKAYQKEIKQLINSGLSPGSAEIQHLQTELNGLITEQNNASIASRQAAIASKEAADAARVHAEEEKAAADAIAAATVKILDAKNDEEKKLIQLQVERDTTKDKIRDLIKQGYTPEGKEVKALEQHYKSLTEELKAQERQRAMLESSVKGAIGAFAAITGAIAGVIGVSLKSAAATEDMVAQFQPLTGSVENATDLVNQLNQVAIDTPFELDTIADSVKALLPAFQGNTQGAVKAFKMLGDTAQGNGQKLESITRAYTKAMLKGKTSMEELNMIADAGVPIYTEMAASMGITVEELTKMSSKGELTAEDLSGAFQRMTSEGGVFFEGMIISSKTFSSLLLGIQENIGLAAGVLGDKFLPKAKEMAEQATEIIKSFTDWISTGDNLEDTLYGIGYVVSGVTAGLTAFLLVAKGHAVITMLNNAFTGLTAAMAANPIGAAAVVITTVAIPAFIALNRHINEYDKRFEKQQSSARELAESFNGIKTAASSLLDSYEQMNPEKAIDKQTTDELIRLYPDLRNELSQYGLTVDSVREKLKNYNSETAKENIAPQIRQLQSLINEWETYQRDLAAVRQEQAELNRYMEENPGVNMEVNKQETEYSINFNIQKVQDAEKAFRETLERANGIAELYGLKIESSLAITKLPAPTFDKAEITSSAQSMAATLSNVVKKSLSQRLSEVALTPDQAFNEQIDQFKRFLDTRADLEQVDGEERIVWLERQREAIAKISTLSADEVEAGQEAINQAIDELSKKKDATLAERLRAEYGMETEQQEQLKNQFIQFLNDRMDAEKLTGEQRISWIQEQAEKILAIENLNVEERAAAEKALVDMIEAQKDTSEKSLTERIQTESMMEKAKHDADLLALQEYLSKRFEAEKTEGQTELDWLKEHQDEIQGLTILDGDERIHAEEAVTQRIKELAEEQKQAKITALNDTMSATSQFIGSIGSLTDAFVSAERQKAQEQADDEIARIQEKYDTEKKMMEDKAKTDIEALEWERDHEKLNKEERQAIADEIKDIKDKLSDDLVEIEKSTNAQIEAEQDKAKSAAVAGAKFSKGLAHAAAGINSFLAFTQALSYLSNGITATRILVAGSVLAAGIAQQVQIANTPIPGAETGAHFTVPDTTGRVDGELWRFNPGETVTVTPRGMTGESDVTHIHVYIDNQPIFNVVNKGIRSKDIVITAENL
jgi:tape measure domain-containing protein